MLRPELSSLARAAQIIHLLPTVGHGRFGVRVRSLCGQLERRMGWNRVGKWLTGRWPENGWRRITGYQDIVRTVVARCDLLDGECMKVHVVLILDIAAIGAQAGIGHDGRTAARLVSPRCFFSAFFSTSPLQ